MVATGFMQTATGRPLTWPAPLSPWRPTAAGKTSAPAASAGDFAPPVSMPRSAPSAAASEVPDELNQGITDDDDPF